MSLFKANYYLDYSHGYYVKLNNKAKKATYYDLKRDTKINYVGNFILTDDLYATSYRSLDGESTPYMHSNDVHMIVPGEKYARKVRSQYRRKTLKPIEYLSIDAGIEPYSSDDIEYIENEGDLIYIQDRDEYALKDIFAKDEDALQGKDVITDFIGENGILIRENGNIISMPEDINFNKELNDNFIDGTHTGIYDDYKKIMLLNDKNELTLLKIDDIKDKNNIKKFKIPKEMGKVNKIYNLHSVETMYSPVMIENEEGFLMHVNIDDNDNTTFGEKVHKDNFLYIQMYDPLDEKSFDIGKRFRKNNIYMKDDVKLNNYKKMIILDEGIHEITLEC